MKTKLFLYIALFIAGISNTSAHALWIETMSVGKKGCQQEVKIFFGAYGGKEIDTTKNWFSNLKDFSIMLTAPNGSTQVLKATADVLFYKANFTPTQEGVYRLSIVHEVATIYENAKIAYYAFADVAVGSVPKINGNYPADALLTFRAENPILHLGSEVSHQVLFNKMPFAKQKITLIDPSVKNLEIETDGNGKFTLLPTIKGRYFLEAFIEDKKPGILGRKAYEKVWHVATHFANIPEK